MISKDLIQKIRRIEITTNRIVNEIMAGQYVSAFKGRGMEFSEVREYIPGDDVRNIDWNVTARYNKPFVKRFIEERELTVLFLNDVSGSQHFGSQDQLKSELSAEICAVLAFAAIRSNDQVGSIIFSDRIESYIPPKKGAKHVLRVIRDLLHHRPVGHGTDIAGVLEYLGKVQRRRSVVFLVSDFLDTGIEKSLRIVNRHHDLVAIVVEDPREYELPSSGWTMLSDAETGEDVCVNLGNRDVRTAFTQRIQSMIESRDKMFSSAGIDCLKIRLNRPYEADLFRFLKARAQRMR